MATFKICIFEHQQRRDGNFPVSIRVTWKSKQAYIKTEYYVSKKQITRDFEVKDSFILRELHNRIALYEEIKSKQLGQRIELYTAKELCDYFVKQSNASNQRDIDFIEFAETFAANTENDGTAGIYKTVINSIKRYTKTQSLYTYEITSSFLMSYEKWLTDEKLTLSGINLYMRTFKALFNRLRDEYNDEDRGEIVIPFNPFKKYKAPKVPLTQKRALTIEQIRQIRDYDKFTIDAHHKYTREQLAVDVFMLSFYLIGMNTADLYNCTDIKDGRLSYNRTKTKTRRQDKAFISIKVETEALPLIEKYKDETGQRVLTFYRMFRDSRGFNKSVNQGLKIVAEKLKFDFNLEFYAARHSWATIARNDCKISKDDIHEALNHSDPAMAVTDIYIKKDFSIIDEVNRKVLDIIK